MLQTQGSGSRDSGREHECEQRETLSRRHISLDKKKLESSDAQLVRGYLTTTVMRLQVCRALLVTADTVEEAELSLPLSPPLRSPVLVILY